MTIDAADWYDATPDPVGVFQGDVLENVPVVFMPPAGSGKWVLLRPSFPVTLEQALAGTIPKSFRPHVAGSAPEEWKTSNELVLAKATKQPLMIVTQTCDLERRNFVQVAPVYPITSISTGKQASVQTNEVNYLFYLPAPDFDPKKHSFGDLSQIVSVHTSYLKDAKVLRRLSNDARARFQLHLATLHGRPFGFTVQDKVTQSAEYLCLRCFLTDAVVKNKTMVVGDKFAECDKCMSKALWIKFK